MEEIHERERTPNPLLTRQRQLRGWSQGQVAKELQALFPGIAVTARHVARWESGKRRPGPYYREKLCVLFQTTADKLGFIPQDGSFEHNGEEGEEAQEGELSFLWTVPSRRNPFFTGRDQLIQTIRERFVSSGTSSFPHIQALCGLGGIGKTQIVIEYAHRYRDSYQFVLWVKAARSTLLSDFVMLADLLNLPEKEQKDQSILIASIKRWFVSHDRWLLIFDNVDDIEPVYDLLPAELHGHVLLTTRIYALGTFAHRVEVEKMDAEEGALLLLRRAKMVDGSSSGQGNTEALTNAKVVVDLLDGLPLALDQAGAYIEETACTVSHYVRAYRSRQSFLLNRRGSPALDHPDSVGTTFSLSFEHVQQVSPLAAELLQSFAFLAPDAIPDELLLNGAKELAFSQDIVNDPLLFDEAIATLRRFSLIRRNRENHTLTIHRLVQIVLKEMMSETERCQWAERIVRTVNRVLQDFHHFENVQYQRYLPHAQVCLGFIEQWNMTFIEAASLLSQTGLYLKDHAEYEEAENCLRRSLTIYEVHFGPDHIDIAVNLNNLALVCNDQGKYAQSEALFKNTLAIYERSPVSSPLDTATILNNLALLYDDQGNYVQSEPICQQALDIHIQVLGTMHPLVASSLNNLAGIYRRRGCYRWAESLLNRALEIYEQTVGWDHLFFAVNLENLAGIYRRQGRYAEAEKYFERALAIREKILGPWHPQVATCLNNLAVLYDSMGKREKAKPFHDRALMIYEQVLGVHHPYVAISLSNLAIHYYHQQFYDQAKRCIQRALEIDEQALGSMHPGLANDLNILAVLFGISQKFERAEILHSQARDVWTRMLGPNHSHVAHSLNNLAVLYHVQAQYAQAESLYRQALSIYWQTWQPDHPEILVCLSNLTKLFVSQEKYALAELLYQYVLSAYKDHIRIHPLHQSVEALQTEYTNVKYNQAHGNIVTSQERGLSLELDIPDWRGRSNVLAETLGLISHPSQASEEEVHEPFCSHCGQRLAGGKTAFCYYCGKARDQQAQMRSDFSTTFHQQLVHQAPTRPIRQPLIQELTSSIRGEEPKSMLTTAKHPS
jgi:tetratricopeptide (TPR) repeat protein/transcriptional regulator with XRE-family HTH domain